jgi:hypothetical protein
LKVKTIRHFFLQKKIEERKNAEKTFLRWRKIEKKVYYRIFGSILFYSISFFLFEN